MLTIALIELKRKHIVIPIEKAIGFIEKLHSNNIKNLFAQADARRVLYEVGETEDNFPRFDPALVDKVTFAAYSILSSGVSLAEHEMGLDAISAMEEAAILLYNVHSPHVSENISSKFHVLIAAMAFHAAGQYSRAFVSIRKVETQTNLSKMVAAFMRKQPYDVILSLNSYILADVSEMIDPWSLCDHSVTNAIARSFSLMLEFFATGNTEYFELSIRNLDIAMDLAKDFESPTHWWIARLLRLMILGYNQSSPWSVLTPYFQGDISLLDRYIKLLVFGKHSITELWRSQQEAIPNVLGNERSGSIVNMRTSAGKTRIAELAILQTLHENSEAKILYLAPFRSLALEIEQSLSQIFDWCGYPVSHLYGGFQFSAADRQLAEQSTITIATPEKARAILRASPDFLGNIKLIIVDEGHLLGASERYVKNELFIDHLKAHTESTGSRIIMLSAVLPNPDDLAIWLTGDSRNVAKSNWKPSSERFGFLRWQGHNVRIDWLGELESFNPNFVRSEQLRWGRRRKPFPSNKQEAVAATAVKLSSTGPVMIFSARASSIPKLAEAALLALGENPTVYPWPEMMWTIFEATCHEELNADAIELKAARYGVICHSNKLPAQVRAVTEKLMRSAAPKIIIASSTLAQGVNIGVSSVIVATPYQSSQPIDHRDFWNICGRAGRAFVDGEGKILYLIDETDEQWKITKNYKLAKYYFKRDNINPVESGLLDALNQIYQIAQDAGIDFGTLITMIADNDFTAIGTYSHTCLNIMELIDDGLLALQEDTVINPNIELPEEWVNRVFRNSLAVIQAERDSSSLDKEQVLAFIKMRANYVLSSVQDPQQRRAYVSSGLPLSVATNLYRDREEFIARIRNIIDGGKTPLLISIFLEWLEEWARENALGIVGVLPEKSSLDLIRENWLSGRPMRDIREVVEKAEIYCKDIYGYQLPWLLHAAAQQIKQMGNDEFAEALSSMALLVELGVPTEKAAFIFLSGIRSRVAAAEVSACGLDLGNSIAEIRRNLHNSEVMIELYALVSASSQQWLGMYWSETKNEIAEIPKFPRFILSEMPNLNTLVVRSLGERFFLCSIEGLQKIEVAISGEWPFDHIANDYRFSFQKADDGKFDLIIRDPKGMR